MLPRYLLVDLDRLSAEPYPISEDYFRLYLGGKALAARLLLDLLAAGTDPLAAENVLIVNTGPLTGTGAPASGRFNITTRNVLTGGIASSNCGGNFGIKLRRAGVDGLIIRGRAAKPAFIEVVGGRVKFHSAEHLWGKDTEETQQLLPAPYGKLVIGPAGENMVSYAAVISQQRAAARCGVGAVFGSKNLKAVIAYGVEQIPVADRRLFAKLNRRWLATVQANAYTSQALPRYGTMGFINKGNVTGVLPAKNFSQDGFAQAELISGEHYAKHYLTRNYGCVGCPIRCGRRQMLDGREVKGPEYETVGLLGPNLLNHSLERISRWNQLADALGLDTISLGGTLGFAMELKERGLADLGVGFDDLDSVGRAIADIASRRGKGDELANGSRWLADKYGGHQFAPHARGMEMAAYDPRRSVGLGLGYATSNRGACHLNGGYMVFLEALGPLTIDAQTPRGKAALTVLMQNTMEAISLSGMCLFTSMAMFPNSLQRLRPYGKVMKAIARAMAASGSIVGWLNNHPGVVGFNIGLVPYPAAIRAVTGLKLSLGKFILLGERSYNLERLFNVREGVAGSEDKLCRRMTAEPKTEGRSETAVPLNKMLPQYYRIRGWDSQGVPSGKKLAQLGIKP